MPPEQLNIHALERFRSPKYSFLYLIDDTSAIDFVIRNVTRVSYGLETGVGEEPVRLFHVDNRIPWIATENDITEFYRLTMDLRDVWGSVDPRFYKDMQPIYALRTASSYDMMKQAHTLVYRNPHYVHMNIVPYAELGEGQRMVFIVNQSHVKDLHLYGQYLKDRGYDPRSLHLRPKSLPPLTKKYLYSRDEYVLDVTK